MLLITVVNHHLTCVCEWICLCVRIYFIAWDFVWMVSTYSSQNKKPKRRIIICDNINGTLWIENCSAMLSWQKIIRSSQNYPFWKTVTNNSMRTFSFKSGKFFMFDPCKKQCKPLIFSLITHDWSYVEISTSILQCDFNFFQHRKSRNDVEISSVFRCQKKKKGLNTRILKRLFFNAWKTNVEVILSFSTPFWNCPPHSFYSTSK